MNHFSVFWLRLYMKLTKQISALEDNTLNGLLGQGDGAGASTPPSTSVVPPGGGGQKDDTK